MFPYKIIVHQGNPLFSREVAKLAGQVAVETNYRHFPDGELYFQVEENVREHNVYVVYSLGSDINRDIVELLLQGDTLIRSSANKITLVMPYFPYCRQDRKCVGREPISASAVAGMLENVGYHRLICMDLHNPAIQGFTRKIPFDNLSAEPLFCKYIKEMIIDQYMKISDYNTLHEILVIVSPDEGGAKRTSQFKDRLNNYLGLEKDKRLQMVTMVKKRGKDGDITEMESNIPVPDKVCIIIDDIIDTAGTLMKAVSMLKQPRVVDTGVVTSNPDGTVTKQNVTLKGASKVYAMVTHALLNDKPPTKDKDGTIATELIMNEDLEELVVTNSVYLGDKPTHCPKMKVLDITEMFSQAIVLNQEGKSTKPLFDPLNYSKSIDWYLRYTGKIIGESPDHPHLLSSESEMNLLALRRDTHHRHSSSVTTTLIDEDDSEVMINFDFAK